MAKEKSYHHIFFDLDRTLWDFDRNSEQALKLLYEKHEMQSKLSDSFENFLKVYKDQNAILWGKYREGLIEKNDLRRDRFFLSFQDFGYEDKKLALRFNDEYVESSSAQTHLMPGTIEVLDYLFPKYDLHVITNGFVEAQTVKLDNCNLNRYFKQVIISDGLGYRKPDKRIFHHAMKMAGARSANSLMVGDDYGPDVLGAKAVGMDQVFLEWQKEKANQATYTIHSLRELMDIL